VKLPFAPKKIISGFRNEDFIERDYVKSAVFSTRRISSGGVHLQTESHCELKILQISEKNVQNENDNPPVNQR